MQARPGDRLVVRGHRTGEAERSGEILEVHGEDHTPPFLVRWFHDNSVGLVFPGPDAIVEPKATQAP